MTLKAKITEDMKAAMRAKDTQKLGTIRMLTAAIKQKEIDERIELEDSHIQAIIERMVKQRKDAIKQFEAGDRHDLAEIEKAELVVLADYMPAQLTEEEIAQEVVLATVDAAGPQDMGKVMGMLKKKLSGRADIAQVSALVKEALTR